MKYEVTTPVKKIIIIINKAFQFKLICCVKLGPDETILNINTQNYNDIFYIEVLLTFLIPIVSHN